MVEARRLTEPPRPLRHWAASADAGGIPSVSLAADSSLCGGSQRKSPKKDGLLPSFFMPSRCMSAAALSAAVDTTKLIGDHTHSQAEPSKAKTSHLERQPLFGRGGLGERGFSQRSRLSPRISDLPHVSSEGSAREGTSLQRSPLPRNLQFQEKKGTMELFIWHHLFQTVDEEVLQWSSTCS